MAGLWDALTPNRNASLYEGGPTRDDLIRGQAAATAGGMDRITEILTTNASPSMGDIGTAALRAAGGGQPYGQGLESVFASRRQQSLDEAGLQFNLADRFADQITRLSQEGNADAQETIKALEFFGWDSLPVDQRGELAKRLNDDPEIITGDNAYSTIARVYGGMDFPAEFEVPKVVTYNEGGTEITEVWRYGSDTPERYEGPRWKPDVPGSDVPDLVKTITDDGEVIWTPKGQAAGMRTVGDGDGTGGPTPAQTANNREINKAREYILSLDITPEEILKKSQAQDEYGFPNPDYDPLIATHVRTALQAKVGGDQEYDDFWGALYGPGQAPPPASAGGTPKATVTVGGVTGNFTGEYDNGAPVYLDAEGRRFVVEE